ncbi:acyltransferase family protein [Aerosakkonemataceae cyanobacterium BLCC-F50]|uniref:Acyltransferase family protein n=1 Tax=Floridaenema flaviceps BLCC-F50 TaxID=3153642 RepID=A0ABV4XXB0_9CYAN
MDFTKEKTNIAKGLAICLMFSHHLYAFPKRLLHGNYYIPMIPFFNAEYHLGIFGSICVSMFLFLSGYGMFLGYNSYLKSPILYTWKKLKELYLTYWLYFLIFVPIGLIFFKDVTLWKSNEIRYSTEWRTLVENFLGWSTTYNQEWWFVRMFVLLLIFLCPLYLVLSKQNLVLLSLLSLSIFIYSLILNVSYHSPLGFMFLQISFTTGIVCAKVKFFSSRFVQYFDDNLKEFGVFFGIVVCFLLQINFGRKIEFLLMPLFIYFVIRAISALHLSKLLAYIGVYSFPLWLVHSFFCYYYFQDIIYFPRWSPLIFVSLMGVSLLSVLSIEYLRSRLKIFI